jgi:hypothetical protein
MKLVLVNGRSPRPESFCALCCEPIGESYLRDLNTRLSYCNYECYLGHCKLALSGLKEHERASRRSTMRTCPYRKPKTADCDCESADTRCR